MRFAHFTPLLIPLALAIPHSSQPKPSPPLSWDVYLSPALPVVTTPQQNHTFSQTAITLISGQHTAILVDCPPTYNSTSLLADWLDTKLGKLKLTHVYITHGHGDHFFGIPVLQKRFPGLQVVATPDVIAHAKEQGEGASLDFWTLHFPNNQLPPQTESWTPLPSNNTFLLEGHTLQAVPVGFTDTYNSTVLHIPSLSLVVAGDVVYGSYYQYLVESHTPELRAEWIRALRKVEELQPQSVVPSHMQEWDGFGPGHIGRTKEFLNAWGTQVKDVELEGNTKGKDELKERIESAFPERKGDFILDVAAAAAFPEV